MTDIEKFKKVKCFSGDRELTPEELEKLGLPKEDWMSLEECAYQCAYDISEDWAKDNPTWDDIKEAYRRGVADGIDYAEKKSL